VFGVTHDWLIALLHFYTFTLLHFYTKGCCPTAAAAWPFLLAPVLEGGLLTPCLHPGKAACNPAGPEEQRQTTLVLSPEGQGEPALVLSPQGVHL
jgi:hypothetical protein